MEPGVFDIYDLPIPPGWTAEDYDDLLYDWESPCAVPVCDYEPEDCDPEEDADCVPVGLNLTSGEACDPAQDELCCFEPDDDDPDGEEFCWRAHATEL